MQLVGVGVGVVGVGVGDGTGEEAGVLVVAAGEVVDAALLGGRVVRLGVGVEVKISCFEASASFGLPASQVSMNSFQVRPGRSRPYSGWPFAS